MAKITIIGCSNTRNAFSGRLKQVEKMGRCKAEYVSATSITAGYKALKDAREATILVICFLLNGISDATELCKDEEAIQTLMTTVIDQYCQAILDSAEEKPNCQHYVMSPFFRSSPQWLTLKMGDIISAVHERLALHKGIYLIPALDFGMADLFDGVHLNSEAQVKLFNHISAFIFPPTMAVDRSGTKRGRSDSPLASPTPSQSTSAPTLTPEVSELDRLEHSGTWVAGPSAKIPRTQIPPDCIETPDLEIRDLTVEGRLTFLEDKVENQRKCMTLMIYQSANQADITDSLTNTNNLNQVIVSGITDGCFDLGWSPHIRAVVDKLVSFTKVHPGAVSTATAQQFPIPKGQHLPDLRIIFNCPQAGLLFRQQAHKLRKDKAPGWAGIFVSNVATRSTQVRVALLQSIAKALQRLPSNAGKIVMVTRFDTRPQLCYKIGTRIEKRLFYIDAIQKYESLLTPADLAYAKKIAGKAFEDRLRPIFAIM